MQPAIDPAELESINLDAEPDLTNLERIEFLRVVPQNELEILIEPVSNPPDIN